MTKITRIQKRRLELPREVIERRVAPRADIDMPVRVHIASVEDAFTGLSVNISTSGMFIATQNPPPLGTLLDLELLSNEGKLLLHARARVMRHQGQPQAAPAASGSRQPLSGMGVKFESISYEAQALIERMVRDQRGDAR